MGIRETLNENPSSVVKGAAVLVALALVLLVYHLWPVNHGTVSAKDFFSDDDGDHWFADDAAKIAPFDHDGKEAVLARVYTCGGRPFVGYLQKFSPELKKVMEDPNRQPVTGVGKTARDADPRVGILYKKPHGQKYGDKWVSQSDPDYKQVIEVHCPDGHDNELQPLTP